MYITVHCNVTISSAEDEVMESHLVYVKKHYSIVRGVLITYINCMCKYTVGSYMGEAWMSSYYLIHHTIHNRTTATYKLHIITYIITL